MPFSSSILTDSPRKPLPKISPSPKASLLAYALALFLPMGFVTAQSPESFSTDLEGHIVKGQNSPGGTLEQSGGFVQVKNAGTDRRSRKTLLRFDLANWSDPADAASGLSLTLSSYSNTSFSGTTFTFELYGVTDSANPLSASSNWLDAPGNDAAVVGFSDSHGGGVDPANTTYLGSFSVVQGNNDLGQHMISGTDLASFINNRTGSSVTLMLVSATNLGIPGPDIRFARNDFTLNLIPDDGEGPVNPGLSDEDIIAIGLASWRKPDGDGISCAECHTPMGYDIAIFDFDQEDLRRATAPHLTDDDADDIFAMIEVLRDWYPPANGLKDVETFRPMQPGGGVVLGGVNSTLQERDDAFGEYLYANYKIAQSPIIDTLAKANEALEELVAIDLRDLPVGIIMNKWSEAVSRSGVDEGGRIAEWITGIGLQPRPQHESAWLDLVDDYIAYPSDENFWAMFAKIDDYLDFDPVNAAPVVKTRWLSMASNLFKSNNVFAHNELNKAIGAPELEFSNRVNGPFPEQANLGIDATFIWDVGNDARQLDGGGSYFDEMPLRHQETLFNANGSYAFRDRITDLRTTWFWLGFTLDPTMWNSGTTTSTLVQEYMMNWGYRPHRSHYAFANAMVMASRGMLEDSWNPPGRWQEKAAADQHMNITNNTNFFAYNRYRNSSNNWGVGTQAHTAYLNIIANSMRAVVLRSTADIIAQGRHWTNQTQLENAAENYRNAINWADPANEVINNQIIDAFLAAVQSHPQ